MMQKRNTVTVLMMAAVLTLPGGAVSAQPFPTMPIRIIMPQAPGALADVAARMVAQKMGQSMGQPVLIENRPGAGVVVAAQAVLRSNADGHAMLLTGSGTAVSVSLFKSLPYDIVEDFASVSTMASFDLALLVAADSRFNSIAEVTAYARGNPGKLNIGTMAVGTTQYLAVELLKMQTGIDVQTVPFKGSGPLLTTLRSNEVQLAIDMIPSVMSQIRSGTIRALAVTSGRRFTGLPNTPTVTESGIAGYQVSSWNGLSVRAGTPQWIIERLNREIVAAVNTPDVKQKLAELGADARASTPGEMREILVADIAKWKTVIERARIERQ